MCPDCVLSSFAPMMTSILDLVSGPLNVHDGVEELMEHSLFRVYFHFIVNIFIITFLCLVVVVVVIIISEIKNVYGITNCDHTHCFPRSVESPHLRQARSLCELPQTAAQPLPERV